MRTMVAKFAGRCFACERPFAAGTTVAYTGKCWCVECWDADQAKENAEEAARTVAQEARAKAFRAGLLVRATVTETGPLKCGQPGTRGKLFVTMAPDAKMARDEANAFVASVRAAGGRAKLLGHTRNGKHYVGREVASYYGMSTMGHHEGYGSKYQAGLDVTDIAKLVRKELAALVKAGELPAAKYSVRCSRYSMGRSLDVSVSNVPFALLNEERMRHDVLEPNRYMRNDELPRNSVAARALLATVEAVVAAYNFDGSDMQSDHYHVNFSSTVDLDWRAEQAEREALEARFAAKETPVPVLTSSTCRPLAPFPKVGVMVAVEPVDTGCARCGAPSCLLPDPAGDQVSVAEAWV